MTELSKCVPPAFSELWPGYLPVHVVCIIEAFDPEGDSVELVNIVDDGLRTWAALGMVSVAQAELSHAMVLHPTEGEEDGEA